MEQAGRSFAGLQSGGWILARNFVPLADNEVQIWQVKAVSGGTFYDACLSLLSPDELERSSRLRAGVARDEFVVARGCLRALLGAAEGADPKAITLSLGQHGKPFAAGIEFNVSHSKGLILLALSRDTGLGIDLEWMDAGVETMEIAQDIFAPSETAYLATAEGEARVRAFYRCWVRKEAVAKVHGQGITLSLRDFQVDLASEDETSVRVSTDSGCARDFYLRGLPLEGRFAGALALTSPRRAVRLFKLIPEAIGGAEGIASGPRFALQHSGIDV